ncbi:branched-chain amino acid ABC transporter permease [Polymorphum gilvum]|uniref:ABC transporter permease protein n=1 Tax=Polymorphum gilvum (strain LMG 25793 / CGMCC 1.9160 / SL003B-26A1) TaxID=991905 RepID=F2J4H5_POLGS|nr:branched-chain amino acid ABC transporter permease [Polymorphum gilvum]ADZ72228.1 ABC transporter permease protein [Polymorphum gilvum SL003B-26A1]
MTAAVRMTPARWTLLVLALIGAEAANRFGGAGLSLALSEMLILALFASSLNLLMTYGHMVSFGHAAYFGLGAYGFTLAVTRAGVPVEAALVLGPLVATLGGIVFGALCVRLTEIYFAMLTLACAQITYTVLFQWYGFTGGDTGITGFMPARFGLSEANFTSLVLAVLVVGLAILARIINSPLGLSIRSVGQDRWRAEALGLAPRRVQLTVFAISAFFAGVAGTLYAVFQGAAFPDYAGLGFTLDALIMVVIGGLRSFWGGVVGAIVFSQLRHWAPLVTNHWGLALGLILLAIVILLPHGLTSLAERLGLRQPRGGRQ